MTFVLTPYAIICAATAGVALIVAYFAWRRRRMSGGSALVALMIAVCIWAAGTALEYATVGIPGKVFWSKMAYFGVLSAPVFYLLFALHYNQLERWLTRRTIALLFVVPLLTLGLAFTNEWHGLIWSNVTPGPDGNNLVVYGHGTGFWLGVVGYAYLLMAIATWLFVRSALRLSGIYRRQIILILVAALAPWLVNIIYLTGRSPLPGLELTPLVLVFSGALLGWAILGFQLLDLAPVARQMLIETMSEGMIVLNRAQRVVDINPAAQQLVGLRGPRPLGRPIEQLLPDWATWEEHYWSRGQASAEIALHGAEERYLRLTVVPLHGRRGEGVGRLLTMHDITAWQQTEAALVQQNDYLHALQQTSLDLIAQLDLARLLENVVLRAGQLVGTSSGYLDLVDPDSDRLKPQIGVGALQESLRHSVRPGEGVAGTVWQTGQPLVIDDYDAWSGRIDKFAPSTLHSVVGVPLRLGAEVLGVLGLGHPAGVQRTFTPDQVDLLSQFGSLAAIAISNARLYAQAQREKQYFESLLHNSPAATTIIDLEGRIRSWNPAAEALFGYTPSEAIGRTADRLVAGGDNQAQEARSFTRHTLERGPIRAITRRTRKDGVQVDVELRAVPVVVDDKTTGALAIYHDITELQKARRAAEAASSAKSEFLANMSHELRTPLNAILGFSRLMARDSQLSPGQAENLAIINRSGEHLLGLINDVLDMAKIEAGRTTLQEHTFDLHHLLDDLGDLFRLSAAAKGLTLNVTRTPDVPRFVHADESKLRQVLINLLGNAVKFTATGSVELSVSPEGTPAAGEVGLVRFTVQDTGPGIAPDELTVIFEPFVQSTSSRTTPEGTGLGLPISRQFVHLMGGELTVSSAGVPGEGSRFEVLLPLRPAEAVDLNTMHPLATRRIIGLEPGQPAYRLLVADDRAENRKLLADMLTQLGFTVRAVENGLQAIQVWEEWQPQMVWMDLRMPVLDGSEAAKRIKATAQGQQTAVIAVSAGVLGDEQAAVLAEGCDDFVPKPYREDEIVACLVKHLGVRMVCTDIAPDSAALTARQETAVSLDLANLPAGWLSQVTRAALTADAAQLQQLIINIRDEQPALAQVLSAWIEDYDYGAILAAVTTSEAGSSKP